MATVIHRRMVRRPPRSAPATPGSAPAEPRGPGAFLAPLAALTVIGWASVVVAAAWLVNALWPLVEVGVGDASTWGDKALYVVRVLGDAAPLLLPAALELGVPDARRRTPWLMRGAVLLALAQLARPAIGFVQERFIAALDPTGQPIDYETPLGFAFGLVTVASALLTIGGQWALSDGLWDAGARPRRAILAAVAAVGVIGTLVAFLPYFGTSIDLTKGLGWLNVASIGLSLATIGLVLVVATRLMSGFPSRLVPRRAWAVAVIAGAGLLVEQYGSALILGAAVQGQTLGVVVVVAGSIGWVVLAVALALGLGRGTERRLGRRPLVHLYVRNPTD